SGTSSVNESMITGESELIEKLPGSSVIAGSVNGVGSMQVRVASVGESTILAGIMRLVSEAESSKSSGQILADRAAYYLTIIAIVAGLGTFLGWLLAGASYNFALERMVTVLIMACPHALGLAIPLVTSISTTLGARNGILVKQRIALEQARNLDVVVFDKTGTLTEGRHGVTDIYPSDGYSLKEVVTLAAAVESDSEHAIGKAIRDEATKLMLPIVKGDDFKALTGTGAFANVDG